MGKRGMEDKNANGGECCQFQCRQLPMAKAAEIVLYYVPSRRQGER